MAASPQTQLYSIRTQFPYRQLCHASSSVPKPAVLEIRAVIKVAALLSQQPLFL